MNHLLDIIYGANNDWIEGNKRAFEELFGSKGGRYPQNAQKDIVLRVAEKVDVPFSAYINQSNPTSGPYGGMSFVLFPVDHAPALVAMVVGTQGLSPDEEVLGRPGHARKVSAICTWLNKIYGRGNMLAWSKQDPTRIDLRVPDHIQKVFSRYSSVFNRYGKEIYGFFAPSEAKEATNDAVKAFLDLMFDERKIYPLKGQADDAERIRSAYFSYMMSDVSDEEVFNLLNDRQYVILEGPPGTGKTRMATNLLQNNYDGAGFSIQFHPTTTYENFVGGLAPIMTEDGMGFKFAPKPGFLMRAVAEALKNPEKPYLLHIDEINRADLSKVLGEAIFLFENQSVEEREIRLAYNYGQLFGDKLKLPPNLHILGTMNSTDRSIAIVDIAVRRRFAFVKLWPQMRVVLEHAGEVMQQAYKELVSIFVEYATDEGFGLVPGHSYFLEKDDIKAVRSLKVNLTPLLEEYLTQGYVAGFSDPIRSYLQWIESL